MGTWGVHIKAFNTGHQVYPSLQHDLWIIIIIYDMLCYNKDKLKIKEKSAKGYARERKNYGRSLYYRIHRSIF